MGFRLEILKRCAFAAGVVIAAACSADAQQGGRRPGDAIIFSSPDDSDVSSNMPSLAAQPPAWLDLANTVHSPVVNPGATPQAGPLPMPPPAISPAEAQRMQRLLDERKNWALLTPEQILGLPTPKKILGLQDRDAFGQPKNETVEEQFYARQAKLQVRTNSDNYTLADAAPGGNYSVSNEWQMNSKLLVPAVGVQGNSTLLNQFLNRPPDNSAYSVRDPSGGWSKSPGLPAPSRRTAPEQQTAVEQFQQMLQLNSSPGAAVRSSAFSDPAFSSSSTTPKPASGQFGTIPMGRSFTPLNSGIVMPARVEPLPGLFGPTNKPLLAPAPEWKPPPPPWMSSEPQLGVMPQRKF